VVLRGADVERNDRCGHGRICARRRGPEAASESARTPAVGALHPYGGMTGRRSVWCGVVLFCMYAGCQTTDTHDFWFLRAYESLVRVDGARIWMARSLNMVFPKGTQSEIVQTAPLSSGALGVVWVAHGACRARCAGRAAGPACNTQTESVHG
jgi:hypothetical protein